MHGFTPKELTSFYITGISYRKTDADIRGQFAISDEKYIQLLQQAPLHGVHAFFVVSTCNRTEIYGFAENPLQLAKLLCSQTEGTVETFSEISYTKQGEEAIAHLFYVGSGLDSQILGDYEIIGQIKKSAKLAKQYNRTDAFIERLLNSVLQSSKVIKNQTALSGGTVSVSFSAVQYIREHVKDIKNKKIILIGTGKIGRNTCKNLVDYLNTRNIALVNRTMEKAVSLAEELGLQSAPIEELERLIGDSDIILVATGASEPAILKSHLENKGKKLVIDLSIPYNVEEAARSLPNITLVDVDQLSKMKDETLARREAEVPKAKSIISEHLAEFIEWHRLRRHVPVLKAAKTKLREIHTSPLFIPLSDHKNSGVNADDKIQRVINGMAAKMKMQNHRGCIYIEAINEFIATGS